MKKIKKFFELTKEEQETYRLIYKLLRRFFYTYVIITGIIIVASVVFSIDIIKDRDFQNWTSFVFELGLGAFLSIVVITYENFQKGKAKKQTDYIELLLKETKSQQDKIARLVEKIEKIEQTQEENSSQKSIVENKFYKLDLLPNLISILFCVQQALQQQFYVNDKHIEAEEYHKTIKNLQDDFGYWSDRITNINSNTYVPPDIRNAVRMLLHQGIKPITSSNLAFVDDFLERTVFHYVDLIIDSEYIKNDNDKTIQKWRTDIQKEKQDILNLRKHYQDKYNDSE